MEVIYIEKIRIDRFISNQLNISRTDSREFLKQGRITCDGLTVKRFETKIIPDKNIICLDGGQIIYKEHIYIILNKPKGYVCSTKDGDSPTVLELIPQDLRRDGLFPAGRLDKDTTGMVLLTDDGKLAHKILSPKKHIPKYYIVQLAQPFMEEYAELFKNGIQLEDGTFCLPANVSGIKNCENCAVIELHEGKFHQIKRMFASVGNEVLNLCRFQMGGLQMPVNLPLGEHLEIMHNDIEKLFILPDFNALSLCEPQKFLVIFNKQ